MTRADVARASDMDLLYRVRQRDSHAGNELLARHSRAVGRVHDDSTTPLHDTGLALLDIARVQDLGVPFRAAWLAHLSVGSLPHEASSDHLAWKAFLKLPHAWRLALWHHQVEGAPVRRTAALLSTSQADAERILRSAHASVMQHVASAHAEGQRAPRCSAFIESFRHDAPASLTRTDRHLLRSHGRDCDDCMPFIRDLFDVQHGLRELLAEPVLGAAAARYLAGKRSARPVPTDRRMSASPLRRRLTMGVSALVGAGLATSLTWVAVAAPEPTRPQPAAQVTSP